MFYVFARVLFNCTCVWHRMATKSLNHSAIAHPIKLTRFFNERFAAARHEECVSLDSHSTTVTNVVDIV